MKILFVITGLGVGGAERQVLDLAEGFFQRGHVVKIAYLIGPVYLQPKIAGIDVVSLGVTKTANGFLQGIRTLIGLVRSFQPDVVHSHMVHANLLTRVARVFVEMPRLVCTAHSTNEGGRLRMLAYRLTDRMADISTNVSQEAVRVFEEKGAVPKGRMIPVLNGIDINKFEFNGPVRNCFRENMGVTEKRILIAVGRFFEAKDYPNLLRAFALVVKQNSNVCLWIVGDGPLRSTMESVACELNLSSHITFFGIRYDIPEIMNAADVFVLSSAWEGFGLVVAEAMATERIVVATDCGGVRELVGDCGYIVPPRDFVQLSNALLSALAMPADKAAEMGLLARQRIVENFGLDAVIEQWLSIYKTTSPLA